MQPAQWTLAGALAGALTAGALWLAREPVTAQPVEARGADEAPRTSNDSVANDLQEAPAITAAPERRTGISEPARAPEADIGVVAYGRVVDDEGLPVGGATPVLEDVEARVARSTSGPEGSWTVLGLDAGPYELRVEVDGFLPHREEVEVPGTRGWRHDVRLQRARTLPVRFEGRDGEALEMQVRDGLAPYLGVAATREAPGERIPGVRGRVLRESEAGRFSSRAEGSVPPDLGPRYQGVLQLKAAAPLWVSAVLRDVVLEARVISNDVDELVFVIDEADVDARRGSVRVRVVERDGGAPITGGVHLEHPSGGLRAEPRVEDGTLVFEGVPPGTLDLVATRTKWERLERSVDVAPGAEIDLGTIELGPRDTFLVRVVDADGTPLASIGVSAARPALAAGPEDLGLRIGLRTDAEGLAPVQHLALGETLVRAGGRDGRALVARVVDTSAEREVELVLPQGTEVVLRRDENARRGVVYVIDDVQGATLFAGAWLPRVTYLVPGTYVLRGDGDERSEFTVGAERVVVRYGAGVR